MPWPPVSQCFQEDSRLFVSHRRDEGSIGHEQFYYVRWLYFSFPPERLPSLFGVPPESPRRWQPLIISTVEPENQKAQDTLIRRYKPAFPASRPTTCQAQRQLRTKS